MGGGGAATYPALGHTRAVAGSLQDRLAQTTAIRFKAQATSGIDDAEGGRLCHHRTTNDGRYYADQNADNPERVLHTSLLCDRVSLIDEQNRVYGILRPIFVASGTNSRYLHQTL